MDPELLRAFLAVSAERHFGQAARSLEIAPSTLSERIKKLELLAGTVLVQRNPVELTGAGQRLEIAAKQAVNAADAAASRLTEIRREPRLELRIGMLSHGGGAIMTELMRSFRRRNPDILIRTVALGFSETASALLGGAVDVAFVRPELNDDRLEEFPLQREQRHAILSRWDERAHVPHLSFADLDHDTFLTPSPGTPDAYKSFLHLLRERNDETPRTVDTQCHSAEEFLFAVAAGVGIATTLTSFTQHYRWPDIAYVPLVDAQQAATTAIVARSDQRPAVREFIDLLLAA